MPAIKTITLGLQGGGSHGAYTWGVLDRLLEDERIAIEGISGASAGAMNAVVLAYGMTVGAREGARAALRKFWDTVATRTPFSAAVAESTGSAGEDLHTRTLRAWRSFAPWLRMLSPYELNPFDINPLRDIVAAQIDFEQLRSECPIRLFIATTRVSTGMLRLFRTNELTLDALLASACLPTLQHSIEIDGEAYWDGGLAANPPVFPMLHECEADELVLVLLEPLPRAEIPRTRDEITERLTEIGFTAALFTELRDLALAQLEARQSRWPFGRLERRLRRLHVHRIDAQEFMSQLATPSRINTDAGFIAALHDEGRRSAGVWLDAHFHQLGARSTFDLRPLLGPGGSL